MITPTITLTVTKDISAQLFKVLEDIKKQDVLVGIPEEKADRTPAPGEKEEMNNPTLLYIHTHGSPLMHIPARPVIEPAIEAPDNKRKIVRELAEAGKAILDGDADKSITSLNKAGMAGANAARAWFTDPRNNWAGNAYSTAVRKLKKLGKGKRFKAAMASISPGNVPVDVSRPLIDTAQMRKAITYVVRENGGRTLGSE